MSDPVGKNDVVACGVQRLAGAEQNSGKTAGLKTLPAAAGAMQNEDGIANNPSRIARWLAESRVVQPQFSQLLARAEHEIASRPVAFDGLRLRPTGASQK